MNYWTLLHILLSTGYRIHLLWYVPVYSVSCSVDMPILSTDKTVCWLREIIVYHSMKILWMMYLLLLVCLLSSACSKAPDRLTSWVISYGSGYLCSVNINWSTCVFLQGLGPEIPEYGTLNVQMKGYDFPTLESYAKFVHNLAERLGLEAEWLVLFSLLKCSQYYTVMFLVMTINCIDILLF